LVAFAFTADDVAETECRISLSILFSFLAVYPAYQRRGGEGIVALRRLIASDSILCQL
jgi:hypothetical protein